MKIIFTFALLLQFSFFYSQNESVDLSISFLKKCKTQQDVKEDLQKIEKLNSKQLLIDLNNDDKRKTFWINMYNACTQYTLQQHPYYFKNKNDFYTRKVLKINQLELSLDEIEHGILRKNTSKIENENIRDFVKSQAVLKIDPRIHFALNCGAKSCPPIYFYTISEINKQLDQATSVYLENECERKENFLYVPIIFSWFASDFGGETGIYQFLQKYNIITKKQKLKYKEYDWSLSIGNYL